MEMRKIMTAMDELLEEYREYLWDEERSRATVEKYLRDVKVFMKYLADDGAEEKPGDRIVDKEKVREYKNFLREHYKVSSANSMLAALNSFFMFAGWEELKVKLFKLQRALYSRPETEMTEKDYEKLIQAARKNGDDKMSMLMQTIGSTGIRISELKFITVESLETGRAEIYNKGKSRVVLLPMELTRLLKKYCRKAGIASGSVFITKHGNPMDRSNVSKKMKQLAEAARVDAAKVFPHNFRHLFARIFYSIEKDVVRLMDLLGHSSINTTRIYTMTTEEQSRKQMSRMKLVLG
ncbi:MAG: tyrosine-type recombinase/integrase [Hungatella hathewayi]|nr:tyrosine-type recombinase/integrase [Hungatella hathewayi]